MRGFNPDPSILRVGEDFYLATSTFEWFPGVQIHHSRDLVNWKLLTRPLNRTSQLDMLGNPDSGGIWAPCLTHDGERFYLIYTDVKHWGNLREPFKDTHNYLVTAENIEGPWSEPIYLNSSGFDPSLFHDDDGRKWLVNMLWDWRKGKNPFAGTVLQEYDAVQQKLVGPIKKIFSGSSIGLTEGPHIYKRGDFYHLMVAEGGTSYDHAVTVARSRTLDGPYELDPQTPLLTSRNHPELPIQKAGHASLTDTPSGEWYLAHLCGRPLETGTLGHCLLGRETSLQKVEWTEEGWLRLVSGKNTPEQDVPAPQLPAHPWPKEPELDGFDSPTLNLHFQSLRIPVTEHWLSLSERPGFLRLKGQESLLSRHRQSLIARRLQAFRAEAETCVEFSPESFQQMAGLVAFYDVRHWVYLRVSFSEENGRNLQLLQCDAGKYDEPTTEIPLDPHQQKVWMRVTFQHDTFHFSYALDGQNWTRLGPDFQSSKLSDDYVNGLAFTGAFVGMCVQDLGGTRKAADFDFFRYTELE
ncbi:glycosyl hydrolase [Deinococcus roseus]|uniref:Glycosyl hydrolase n=1 Tax=Deinococcus roseus TaxID=392414 RepID=A0ABQ2D0U6_9DEIO|nr:glycosyl hydrolase [Deinococcus roseus]